MNLCIINHSLPPYIGGAETLVHTSAAELVKRGHTVTVVAETPILKADLPARYPYKVENINGFRQFEAGALTLRDFLPALHGVLRNRSFDLIHVHNFMPALAVAALNVARDTPIIFSFHSTPVPAEAKILGHFRDYAIELAFTEFIVQTLLYSRLVCPSDYYAEWALKLGAQAGKIVKVYPTVTEPLSPLTKRDQLRSGLGYGSGDFVILCVGRMIKRKGIADLLSALEVVNRRRVRCLIATSIISGSASYNAHIGSLISSSQYLSNHVTILSDSHDHSKMPELLAISDCMVLPSHVEGLGISLIEAMAAGVPVIGCDVPGVREIISHGVNGLLAKPATPASLASRITDLIDTPFLALRLAEHGRIFARQQFSPRQTDELCRIYEETIREAARLAA